MWKQLSAERRQQAAEAFWRDEHAGAEQAEVVAAIAQRIKFRPKSVIALPVEKRAHYLTTLLGVSEMVAARLLVAYHLEYQRPMMGSFLDALKIEHDNGLIADDELQAPPPETLAAAAEHLANTYPSDDVKVYLTTLIWQDPDTWGALSETPQLKPAS
ncbi:MAG: hypothetical protein ABL986_02160 [Vicinamibacterales bacterium]